MHISGTTGYVDVGEAPGFQYSKCWPAGGNSDLARFNSNAELARKGFEVQWEGKPG